MKKYVKSIFLCCICVGLLMLCSGCWSMIFPPPEWHIVTDIESYGIIEGSRNNDRAKEMFSAIFPAQIEDYFQDVTYSYTAVKIDTSDFEIYLEFVLEDSDKFQEYIKEIAPAGEWLPFEYDESYLEYTYADWYYANSGASGEYFCIDSAEIAKVLIQPNEQRVITDALGVHDGGGAKTEYFTCFFDRFNIDPLEYDARPDYNHQDILNGKHRKKAISNGSLP